MSSRMEAEGTIYVGQYSYRKPSVVAAGVLLVIITFALVAWCLQSAMHRNDLFRQSGLLILSILPGCLGFSLLRLHLRRAVLPFAINFDGIVYGKSATPWAEVRGISVHLVDRHLHFSVLRKKLLPDLRVTTDSAATTTELEAVTDRLQYFLKAQHSTIYVKF